MFPSFNKVVNQVILLQLQRFFQSVYVDVQVSFQVLTLSSNLYKNSTRNSRYKFSCNCSDLTQKAFLNNKSSI